MKAIMKLDKKYEMKDIVKTLLKADERMKWDSIQTETQILKEYDKNVLLKRYVVIVPFPFMKNREFIEKQFVFQSPLPTGGGGLPRPLPGHVQTPPQPQLSGGIQQRLSPQALSPASSTATAPVSCVESFF